MSRVAQAAVGKWHGILTTLGIDPVYLKNSHGPCPLCDGRDRFRFDDKNGKGTYFCSMCGSGDAFSLLQKFHGWSFVEAAGEVERVMGFCKTEPLKPSGANNNEKRLKLIHSGLKKITHDDAVGKYLLGRGIAIVPVQDVYFHPGVAYYDKDDEGNPVKVGVFPAMVSIFRNILGETCTYHVTYLTPDGKKIDGYQAKKFMPKIRDMTGGAVRLGGMGESIGIAEGVETALAAMQDSGIPCWAATSAHQLETIQLPESIKSVMIYCDEDKSFTGQKAAYALANRLKVREGRTVNVIRLIDKGRLWTDLGSDMDYCDLLNSFSVGYLL